MFSRWRVALAQVCARETCNQELRDFEDARHNGGSNIAFCDGHVKWLSGQAIVDQWGKLYDGQ